MTTTPDSDNRNDEMTLKVICNDDEKEKKYQANICTTPKRLCNFPKISVNKPLIPLKIALFCWFSGCAALSPFVTVYMKQLGLSLDQLSVIYISLPLIQFFGPTGSGILADKLGRSKPVLLGNMLIALLAANSMLLIPALKTSSCSAVSIVCHKQAADEASMTEHCKIQDNNSPLINCNFHCSGELSFRVRDICFQNYIAECSVLSKKGILDNFTFPEYALDSETAITCRNEYNVSNYGANGTWCSDHLLNNCTTVCIVNTNATRKEVDCEIQEGKTQLFVLSFVLLIPFHIFVSTCYRIFDVTSMSMTETYNSDFGRQRVWSILGSVISAPLSGYIISVSSLQNGPKKYDVAFYIFDALVILTMIVVCKLEVRIDPPAKDMLRKFSTLMKNIDILAFICTVFAIGTVWGFVRLFSYWYLEGLGAPSTLLGLIQTLGSLSGLPFLFASNWFVRKVGSSSLMVLALVAYVIWCTGYSFLVNPWWALIYPVLEILTYHLLWVSVVTHSHSLAPPGLTATVISAAGEFHFGLGKGSGSLIGGIIMSKFGGRVAFRVMAAISAAAAAFYSMYLFARRKYKKKEADLKNTES